MCALHDCSLASIPEALGTVDKESVSIEATADRLIVENLGATFVAVLDDAGGLDLFRRGGALGGGFEGKPLDDAAPTFAGPRDARRSVSLITFEIGRTPVRPSRNTLSRNFSPDSARSARASARNP